MAGQRSVASISGMICSAESKLASDMQSPLGERNLTVATFDDKRHLLTARLPIRNGYGGGKRLLFEPTVLNLRGAVGDTRGITAGNLLVTYPLSLPGRSRFAYSSSI